MELPIANRFQSAAGMRAVLGRGAVAPAPPRRKPTPRRRATKVLPGAQPAVPTWQERIPGQAWAIGGLGILALLVILVGWGLGWWSAEEPTPEVPAPTKAPAEAATEPPPEEPPPTSTAGPGLGDTWTRPADGMAMVYVPAGEFEMGSTEDSNEQPVHTVALDGFWIDRTEVTNGQYQRLSLIHISEPTRPY